MHSLACGSAAALTSLNIGGLFLRVKRDASFARTEAPSIQLDYPRSHIAAQAAKCEGDVTAFVHLLIFCDVFSKSCEHIFNFIVDLPSVGPPTALGCRATLKEMEAVEEARPVFQSRLHCVAS